MRLTAEREAEIREHDSRLPADISQLASFVPSQKVRDLLSEVDALRAELAECKARLDATVAADLKVAEALRAECDELNARNVRLLEELVECKAQRDTWEERAEFAASQYRRAIGKEE